MTYKDTCNNSKRGKKIENFGVFYKKIRFFFVVSEKYTTFAPAIRQEVDSKQGIGVWCNGNTADSGPAFPGSSPGTPTKRKRLPIWKPFLYALFSASIAFIFSRTSCTSSFNFCTLRFISSISELPFFEEALRKPRLFS